MVYPCYSCLMARWWHGRDPTWSAGVGVLPVAPLSPKPFLADGDGVSLRDWVGIRHARFVGGVIAALAGVGLAVWHSSRPASATLLIVAVLIAVIATRQALVESRRDRIRGSYRDDLDRFR